MDHQPEGGKKGNKGNNVSFGNKEITHHLSISAVLVQISVTGLRKGQGGNEMPNYTEKTEQLGVGKITTDVKGAEESQDTAIGQQNDSIN